MIVQTRIFSQSTGMALLVLGFFFVVIGLGMDSFASQKIDLQGVKDIEIVRGLYGVTLFSSYGSAVYVRYDDKDVNGYRQDPFCGSRDAPSVFALYLPTMASNPANSSISYLGSNVCCGNESYFPVHRDFNTNNWCDLKEATIALSIVTAVLISVAAILTFFLPKTLAAIIAISILGAIFGLATTSTFATWFFRERDDHKSYIASSITEYDGSSGHSLFLAGWILAALSAAFEIFALCSSSREPDVPPLPTETQYPPSYGAASQPQAYQTYYKPSSPTAHV